MKKGRIKAIISDFDGVLCRDYFYNTLKDKRPDLYKIINTRLFKDNKLMIKDWMRNRLKSNDINKFLSKLTLVEADFFNKELAASVRAMNLNLKLVRFIKKIRRKKIKTAILTDNMDVFRDVFVPYHGLENFFDVIVSSHEYGVLKDEEGGRLLELTVKLLETDCIEILVLDDSLKIGEFCQQRNINFFLYNRLTEDQFEGWFDSNFCLG